jgi:NAD(P)-dependent dehydrogenase (short-subunit alcohol dehydrogenase family)
MNVLITGVSKGIGLALTTEALQKDYKVFGVARLPEESNELLQLQKKFNSLHIIKLDLTDTQASETLRLKIQDCYNIDILINNAGIYEKETTKEAFMQSFEVNCYVPFMVTETVIPKLKLSKKPKGVHITSMMGSITDNTSGGSYAYRSSKSALNMVHKCLSLDHDWLTSIAIHPGWVKTGMGGDAAPLSPKASALGIWRVIEGTTNSESGCFKDYQGKLLPW